MKKHIAIILSAAAVASIAASVVRAQDDDYDASERTAAGVAAELGNARAKAIAMMKQDFHARGQAKMDRLDEDGVMAICNRIMVLSAGRVAGILARGHWSEEQIMAAAFSEYVSGAPSRHAVC